MGSDNAAGGKTVPGLSSLVFGVFAVISPILGTLSIVNILPIGALVILFLIGGPISTIASIVLGILSIKKFDREIHNNYAVGVFGLVLGAVSLLFYALGIGLIIIGLAI